MRFTRLLYYYFIKNLARAGNIFGFFNKPQGIFLDFKKTLGFLKKTNKSIVRFGDGEFRMLYGSSIYFQPYNPKLKNKLWKIIKEYNQNSPYLLALPNEFLCMNYSKLKNIGKAHFWLLARAVFHFKFRKNLRYGDAFVFRGNVDKKEEIDHLLFSKDNLVVVNSEQELEIIEEKMKIFFDKQNGKSEREKTTVNLERKLFFVPIPKTDAFAKYEDILENIQKIAIDLPKNKTLILVAAGPCAKPLVFDLSRQGFLTYDIGHYLKFRFDENKK